MKSKHIFSWLMAIMLMVSMVGSQTVSFANDGVETDSQSAPMEVTDQDPADTDPAGEPDATGDPEGTEGDSEPAGDAEGNEGDSDPTGDAEGTDGETVPAGDAEGTDGETDPAGDAEGSEGDTESSGDADDEGSPADKDSNKPGDENTSSDDPLKAAPSALPNKVNGEPEALEDSNVVIQSAAEYCKAYTSGEGSVAQYLGRATDPADADCLNVIALETATCGQISGSLENLTNFYFELVVVESDVITLGNYESGRTLDGTIVFPEDYNGGSITVTVAIMGAEDDFYSFAGEYDHSLAWYNRGGDIGFSGGLTFTIDTDCQEPEPVNYCDYSQLTGPGSVGDWLASAPEGANTDCIDVGTVVQQCGFIQIPITERVEPFDYRIEYVDENDDVQVLPAEGLSFEEDFNGGSVTYTFYIGGPEQDWVDYANEGAWQYPGQAITIDTD